MFMRVVGILTSLMEILFVILSFFRFFTGGWAKGLWFHILTLIALCSFAVIPGMFYYYARKDEGRKDLITLFSIRSFIFLLIAFISMVIGQILWAFSSPTLSPSFLVVFRWIQLISFAIATHFQLKIVSAEISLKKEIENEKLKTSLS